LLRSKRLIPNRIFAVAVALVVVIVVAVIVLAVTAGGPTTKFPFASLGGPGISGSSTAPVTTDASGTSTEGTVASPSYLELAEAGIQKTSEWWDGSADWFYDQLGSSRGRAQVTLWDSNGMFEALDEIAIANPTAQTKAAVETFASGEQHSYWNPKLKPVPGYSPKVDEHGASQPTWYDDNAWIGIAFLDAYRATGNHTYVTDAERAFAFIAAGGWDTKQGGGMWWSTEHQWLSGEALAAASDLAARLYQTTSQPKYLTDAETYISWANKNTLAPQGVYVQVASTPYPYLIEPNSFVNRRTGARGSQICIEASGSCNADSTEVTPCKTGSKTCEPGTLVIVKCPVGATGCRPGSTINGQLRASGNCPPGEKKCTPSQSTPDGASSNTAAPGGGVGTVGPAAAAKKNASAGPKRVAMPHDGEGAMVAAMTALCEATGKQSWCTEADQRARDDIRWLAPFADGPQYDSVLIRGLLTLYSANHDARLYDFAVKLAGLITEHAQTSANVYLRGWDGRSVPSTPYGSLRSDAGSISVFADLAMVKPPFRAAIRAADGGASGRVPKGPA